MRAFDVILALIGSFILLPLFFIAALLVKVSSSGPVIYSQKRVGLNGRLFDLYKFRSMFNNSGQKGSSVTTGKDPRVTKIGRLLRKTKLDELPQLLNVLKGDMSFVGPRPDVPEIVAKYDHEMKRVLQVRPGITSKVTLYLRNEEDLLSNAKYPDKAYEEIVVPAKVKLAMEHLNKKSDLFDLGILLKTVWTLTVGKIWPIKEPLFIHQIKQDIENMNRR